MKKNIMKILNEIADPDEINDLLKKEDACRSTRTNVPKATPGMKYGNIKGRKPRRNRVRSADKSDERSSRNR